MSYAHYHDELSALMAQFPGWTFSEGEVRTRFATAYPELQLQWLQPSDHCLNSQPEGACWCAGTKDAIFDNPRYNNYVVRRRAVTAPRPARPDPPPAPPAPSPAAEPATTYSAGTRLTAAILEFGATIDPRALFPTLVPEAADLALSDPYAFALATCLDRGTKADIIWTIPYYIQQDLGHLDPHRINEMTIYQLHALFSRLPRKPRYIDAAPRTVQELTRTVVFGCGGDASRMWKNKTAAQVRRNFRNIYGVGEQISNMAVLLIEKAFGIRFHDLERPSIDIKADVHTMRVLYRLGAAPTKSEPAAIAAARRLNPAYPGELDAPLWIIGRQWCNSWAPTCRACPLDRICLKIDVYSQ